MKEDLEKVKEELQRIVGLSESEANDIVVGQAMKAAKQAAKDYVDGMLSATNMMCRASDCIHHWSGFTCGEKAVMIDTDGRCKSYTPKGGDDE